MCRMNKYAQTYGDFVTVNMFCLHLGVCFRKAEHHLQSNKTPLLCCTTSLERVFINVLSV